MKLLLIAFVMLLSACSSHQAQDTIYLSSPVTAHEFLNVTSSYLTGGAMANGFGDGAAEFSEADMLQFKAMFSDEVINQRVKQYVMENMPEDLAMTAITFYSTDLGSRYIAAMDLAEESYDESPQDISSQVTRLRNDEDLMAQANLLIEVMELKSLMESILLNGVFKPLVQGILLKQAGDVDVSFEQIEAIAQSSLDESINEMTQAIEGLMIVSLSQFTQSEITQIYQYASSQAGLYENKVLAGAFESALSKSSYQFGEMLAAKIGKRIVKSTFDMEGCKQALPDFHCQIQSIGAYAESVEPLYLGSAVVGKTNQYRFMMTDSDWQQLNVKGGADDMLISKEDGRALISTKYVENTKVDANAYADKTLGDIAKAIEADYHKVNLNVWPFNQGGGLFEVCYVLSDDQELCKLAGGGQVGNDAFYIHAVFEPTEVLTDEVVRVISTAESLNSTSR